MDDRFDLVVIGSGPAGEKGAAQAAYFGKRVAIVERAPQLGGACANSGTIPSKTLRETCLLFSGYKQRGLQGLPQFKVEGFGPRELMTRERFVVETERERVGKNIERHGIRLYQGSASFVDPHTVEVSAGDGSKSRLQADFFLVAVGSFPHHPPGIDFAHVRIHDSDEILDIVEIPRELIVVGAGVIGCEYATMFAALGVHVTLVEPRDTLLPFLDREMAERLLQVMRGRLAMDVRLGVSVKTVAGHAEKVSVELADGTQLEACQLLYAAGRTGAIAGLGLELLGIEPDQRGNLKVDASYRTSASHVYAAGDVIGFPSLASVSMEQARVAVVHAFELGYKERVAALLPYGIYTIPELSMIGETEESAKAKGLDVETGRAAYSQNARGQIIGDQDGIVKLVFQRADRKLVGAHVIGENAAEIIHVAAAVMHHGGRIDSFIEMVFNYPTLCEAFKYAAYDGLGRVAGRPGPSSVTRLRQ